MARSICVDVTAQSALELFPCRVKRDTDQFIVGRPATGSYVALSAGALAATELLRAGRTIADTKAALDQEHLGHQVRLRPLIETLLAAGMVKAVDGVPLPETLPPRRYDLTLLRRRHVAWAFSPLAAMVYVTLMSLAVVIVLGDPRYLPRPADVLIVSDPLVNLALLWGISLIAMTMHELAHLMAALFLGVRASFALSHRFFFAVAQTDLTDLWLVDRSKRYLAYAAGMANDLILGSAAVIVLWLHHHGLVSLPPLLHGALRAAVLVLVFGVLWQFNFYLRTDVYYLVANFTGCRNLWGDAAAFLKARLRRVFRGAAVGPPAGVPQHEWRVVRGFAALMVAGTAAVGFLGALCLGTLVWLLLGGQGGPAALGGPGRAAQVASVDLLPALISLGITCCWLTYSVIRQRRRRARVRYRLVCPEDL